MMDGQLKLTDQDGVCYDRREQLFLMVDVPNPSVIP